MKKAMVIIMVGVTVLITISSAFSAIGFRIRSEPKQQSQSQQMSQSDGELFIYVRGWQGDLQLHPQPVVNASIWIFGGTILPVEDFDVALKNGYTSTSGWYNTSDLPMGNLVILALKSDEYWPGVRLAKLTVTDPQDDIIVNVIKRGVIFGAEDEGVGFEEGLLGRQQLE